MPGQRLRRWPGIKPTRGERLLGVAYSEAGAGEASWDHTHALTHTHIIYRLALVTSSLVQWESQDGISFVSGHTMPTRCRPGAGPAAGWPPVFVGLSAESSEDSITPDPDTFLGRCDGLTRVFGSLWWIDPVIPSSSDHLQIPPHTPASWCPSHGTCSTRRARRATTRSNAVQAARRSNAVQGAYLHLYRYSILHTKNTHGEDTDWAATIIQWFPLLTCVHIYKLNEFLCDQHNSFWFILCWM